MEIGEEIYQEKKEEIEEKYEEGTYVGIDTKKQKIIAHGKNSLETLREGKKICPNTLYIRRVGKLPLLG